MPTRKRIGLSEMFSDEATGAEADGPHPGSPPRESAGAAETGDGPAKPRGARGRENAAARAAERRKIKKEVAGTFGKLNPAARDHIFLRRLAEEGLLTPQQKRTLEALDSSPLAAPPAGICSANSESAAATALLTERGLRDQIAALDSRLRERDTDPQMFADLREQVRKQLAISEALLNYKVAEEGAKLARLRTSRAEGSSRAKPEQVGEALDSSFAEQIPEGPGRAKQQKNQQMNYLQSKWPSAAKARDHGQPRRPAMGAGQLLTIGKAGNAASRLE